jgi:ribosomal protein L35
MPKLKTHKGATKKTNKRKRQLDIDVLVATADHERVMSMLPYGRD